MKKLFPRPVLKIDEPLICKVLSRVNRFTVEVFLNGQKTTAYVNNTGRLNEFLSKERTGFCTAIENPTKLNYRLFGVKDNHNAAIIDTQLQMRVFERALELELIPWLRGWRLITKNAILGKSLIDYLFERNGEILYMEAKSAALRENDYALYPDCPSIRGQRHISDLIDYAEWGGESAVLFIAALPGVKGFKPNREGDPKIFELSKKATKSRVTVKSISIFYDPKDSRIYLDNPDLKVVIK